MEIIANDERMLKTYRRAMTTLTGNVPSVFQAERRKGPGRLYYRLQDNDWGQAWADAIRTALYFGISPNDCTKETVGQYHPDFPEDWPADKAEAIREYLKEGDRL